MKKILILGAQGMLGHDLAKVFAEEKLFLWDREDVDITDELKLVTLVKELKPEIIINAAAYTNVDGAEKEKGIAENINAVAVSYIGEAAQKVGAKVVHISTEYVFNGIKKEGYDEDAIVSPLSVYGASKARGEQNLIASEVEFYIVRTSWLYGHALQKGKPRGKNFIDTILDKAQAGEELKIVNDQYGKPTFAYDLAHGIKTMLWENYPTGIYHLVNEGITTWFGLAEYALRVKGLNATIKPCKTGDFPAVAQRPQFSILNNNKLPKLRNWQQAVDEYLHI
jgi:dTDP-4-dehydrorhamnose reductase